MAEHLYKPLYRPAASSTLPDQLDWEYAEAPWDIAHRRPDLPLSAHRYGVIKTSRELTKDECERFELQPV